MNKIKNIFASAVVAVLLSNAHSNDLFASLKLIIPTPQRDFPGYEASYEAGISHLFKDKWYSISSDLSAGYLGQGTVSGEVTGNIFIETRNFIPYFGAGPFVRAFTSKAYRDGFVDTKDQKTKGYDLGVEMVSGVEIRKKYLIRYQYYWDAVFRHAISFSYGLF